MWATSTIPMRARVGAQQVVGHDVRVVLRAGEAGRVDTRAVALRDERVGLIEGRPVVELLAELLEHERGEVDVVADDALAEPAGGRELGLQRRGQVPVVDGEDGDEVVLGHLLDEVVVEGDARRIGHHAARGRVPRHDARPRDGEAEGLQPVVGHHLEVARVAVEEVVGHVGAGQARPLAAEVVPDAGRAPHIHVGTLHLVRRGGRAEHEVLGEAALLGGGHGGQQRGYSG
ncbi:hypothetical protein ON010_g18157 [Phytophthora cinnamomi]|nr:hypothetical protein ON010_g18157 [Phytophthora cinnamomi]